MATAIIPAYNEAATIGRVVDAARESSRVDDVLVVVDRSTDGTAEVAAAHGARVLHLQGKGKGQAMAAGADATEAPTLLFLDGDLLGLRTEHIDRLVDAVESGGATMACGLFDRGWLNPLFLHVLPILTGERALRRELFDELSEDEVHGYRIEAALNARAAARGEVVAFVCDGLWHRTKEQKFSNPVEGFVRKVVMLAAAVWGYALSWSRQHLVRRRARGGRSPSARASRTHDRDPAS